MTENGNDLRKQNESLTDALALATGIADGLHVKNDAGETIAVIATAPFPDYRNAYVFAAWLRDTFADPEGLAELLDAIEGGGPSAGLH